MQWITLGVILKTFLESHFNLYFITERAIKINLQFFVWSCTMFPKIKQDAYKIQKQKYIQSPQILFILIWFYLCFDLFTNLRSFTLPEKSCTHTTCKKLGI